MVPQHQAVKSVPNVAMGGGGGADRETSLIFHKLQIKGGRGGGIIFDKKKLY